MTFDFLLLPLSKAVVLPVTVQGDDPVTFTPDVLTHGPDHGVAGSGSQKHGAIPHLQPATAQVSGQVVTVAPGCRLMGPTDETITLFIV